MPESTAPHPDPLRLADGVLQRFAEVVGEEHVRTDPGLNQAQVVDWTGRFRGTTPAVVRPADVDEVAGVLTVCTEARVPVVPQGGNTGLVGGGVPRHGEVVLDLGRLTELGPVDVVTGQVTAGAGVTLAALQAHARAAGLAYAVDLAARDAATVGGTIATNAGGLHLLRWGGTRQQLVGIEAVLADGGVLRHLAGLTKDNTGYDLAGLLCGSEGTLAVVTAARLRLIPRLDARVVALLAFDAVGPAIEAVSRWRRSVGSLDAAELFFADGLALVCDREGRRPPFATAWPVYVLVEASAHADPTDALAAAVGSEPAVRDVAVAADEHGRAALWAYREDHTVAINALGPPHKLDVTLPLDRLAEFVDAVRARVTAVDPQARTWLFGHVGDGNLHVNVTGLDPDDESVDAAVLELVASLGGSISAEHGIGVAKRRWLHLNRSATELWAFGAIKQALDPQGILNPGVLLPD